MRISLVSYNVNGIRAAIRKGFTEWVKENAFDILCLQELKAHESQLDLETFKSMGYHIAICEADKKGYSGVAIFSKLPFRSILRKHGESNDGFHKEGRYIEADLGNFTVVSCYFPSGSGGEHRQSIKMEFLDKLEPAFKEINQKKAALVCGDFNICHREIDIHDPVKNKNTSGFKPEERAWMDDYFDLGYRDCFRQFHSEGGRYSWWSLRTRAKERNKGWRIDYITAGSKFNYEIIDCDLLEHVPFSDHCPVYMSIKI
ncbi:MAG: exodeoxyribonuclease III [Chitinophagales bacterium]|nr:exodeoxyribonuclease III [Chitinophagales bacterium]